VLSIGSGSCHVTVNAFRPGELHVWAGGFHGFDALYPQADISATARRTRTDWLARLLPPNGAA
jgi:hypothetical protein